MNHLKLALIALFFVAFITGKSQTKATPHEMGFKVVMKDPAADPAKYIKAALGYWYFDEYRFIDKQRELKFEDGKAILVLYSANQMFEDSKKLVSPLTIKDGASYQEYILAITIDGNSVKPMPNGVWHKNN